MHNAEAIPTTRRAGGLFVLQSFVFRISEKLLNGEHGLALTMQNGRKVQNSPTILFLSQLLHLYGSSWVKIYRKIRIKRRKKVVQKGSLFEAFGQVQRRFEDILWRLVYF